MNINESAISLKNVYLKKLCLHVRHGANIHPYILKTYCLATDLYILLSKIFFLVFQFFLLYSIWNNKKSIKK
jgi:hypothetical protein